MRKETEMNPSYNPDSTAGKLPRERFEPVMSRPVEIENLLQTEKVIHYFNLDGDHEFKTCYGDLCKTVNALMDYSRLLDMVCDEWHLEGFHRATYEYYANKLREIAEKFQTAIGYDYAAAIEKCRKKREKPERENDVGDDALTQAFRRNQQKQKNTPQKSSDTSGKADESKSTALPENNSLPDSPESDSSPWEDDE